MEIQLNLPMTDKVMLMNQIREYISIMPSYEDISLEAPYEGNLPLGRMDATTIDSRCKCDFFESMEIRFNLNIHANGELFLTVSSRELRNLFIPDFRKFDEGIRVAFVRSDHTLWAKLVKTLERFVRSTPCKLTLTTYPQMIVFRSLQSTSQWILGPDGGTGTCIPMHPQDVAALFHDNNTVLEDWDNNNTRRDPRIHRAGRVDNNITDVAATFANSLVVAMAARLQPPPALPPPAANIIAAGPGAQNHGPPPLVDDHQNVAQDADGDGPPRAEGDNDLDPDNVAVVPDENQGLHAGTGPPNLDDVDQTRSRTVSVLSNRREESEEESDGGTSRTSSGIPPSGMPPLITREAAAAAEKAAADKAAAAKAATAARTAAAGGAAAEIPEIPGNSGAQSEHDLPPSSPSNPKKRPADTALDELWMKRYKLPLQTFWSKCSELLTVLGAISPVPQNVEERAHTRDALIELAKYIKSASDNTSIARLKDIKREVRTA